MRQKRLLIFGLGHLAGYIVCEFEGSELWGTCRSRCEDEKFLRVHRLQYTVGEPFPAELVRKWDVVIWNLPPVEGYPEALVSFDTLIPISVPWVFVSATSVFGEGDITEDSPLDPQSDRGRILMECEGRLRGFERHVSIIRPAGLVDETRRPANFLRGLARSSGARTPVNLVHTHDVARFIAHVVENDLFAGDFNLASDDHPTREEFYTGVMQKAGLRPPEWSDEGSVHRIIQNEKSKRTGFEYRYADLRSLLTR